MSLRCTPGALLCYCVVMKKSRNIEFTILSAIGITLILLGHLNYGILDMCGLFPYYSYHVMIFVFISGYFYKPDDEKTPLKFLTRKAKRLLLPYFIWNLIYGIISMLLRRAGFGTGEDISLYNLFIAPFMGGHQFGLNAPAWFIPALFLLELCDMAARIIAGRINALVSKGRTTVNTKNTDNGSDAGTGSKRDGAAEWIWMALYLAIGMLAVYLAKRGSVYDFYKLPGRLMFMAPAFEFGRLYKLRLERKDRVPSVIYFAVLFVINLILNAVYGGLAFSAVWVTGFGGSVITPFVTTFTGIALWLRISKIIAGRLDASGVTGRCILALGTDTYAVCMHHLLVFMGIKGIFVLINRCFGVFGDIDMQLLMNDVYYTYVPGANDGFKLVYLVLGLALPVICSIMCRKIPQKTKGVGEK